MGPTATEPKLHTTNTDTLGSKTGTGAPNPMTHTKDIGYSPSLTAKAPASSAFTGTSGTTPGDALPWLLCCTQASELLWWQTVLL